MGLEYDIGALLLMLGVVSFLGFCLENIWVLVTRGFVDNRNMILPFLLGYGLALAAFYLCLGVPGRMHLLWLSLAHRPIEQQVVLYFLAAFLAVSLGEICLGKAVERVCGFAYWDYSRLPLHITRYTSIPTSLGFALLITWFMGCGFEPLMGLLQKLPIGWARWIGGIWLVVMAWDFVHSFRRMYRTRSLYVRWRHDFAWRRRAAAKE